jgi:uncharacterized GH25 family protein
MKKLLLIAAIALLMATETAHSQTLEQEQQLNQIDKMVNQLDDGSPRTGEGHS